MPDFTDQFNTQLSTEQEAQFQAAYPNAKDLYDYDLRGAFKDNNFEKFGQGHLTDKYKKPNHPTFSTQSQYNGVDGNTGGTWNKLNDGSWTFAPSPTNLQMYKPEELQDYFSKVEPGNKLLTPVPGNPFE